MGVPTPRRMPRRDSERSVEDVRDASGRHGVDDTTPRTPVLATPKFVRRFRRLAIFELRRSLECARSVGCS